MYFRSISRNSCCIISYVFAEISNLVCINLGRKSSHFIYCCLNSGNCSINSRYDLSDSIYQTLNSTCILAHATCKLVNSRNVLLHSVCQSAGSVYIVLFVVYHQNVCHSLATISISHCIHKYKSHESPYKT